MQPILYNQLSEAADGNGGERQWGRLKTFPQEISALIIVLKARTETCCQSEISSAVIAVPTHYDLHQRWATIQAAEIAFYFLSKETESPQVITDLVNMEAASSMPSLAVNRSYQVDELLRRSLIEQNVRVMFSIIGTILVAVIAFAGLYGVLVHSVNSRRREMAIRACFGAFAGDIRKIVLKEAMRCFALAVGISFLAWRPLTILWSSSWQAKGNITWEHVIITFLVCLAIVCSIALKPAAVATKIALTEILKAE